MLVVTICCGNAHVRLLGNTDREATEEEENGKRLGREETHFWVGCEFGTTKAFETHFSKVKDLG